MPWSGLNAAGRVSYRLGTLRWAVGVFCLATGIAMLVSPHQLSSATYAGLQLYLRIWGEAFLLFGVLLVGVAVMTPPRPIAAVTHLLAGAGLLVLAAALAPARGWTDVISIGGLGLGTAASAFIRDGRERPAGKRSADVLLVVCGASSVVTGAAMLAIPGAFDSPLLDSFRPMLIALGAALLVGGLAAVVAQLGNVRSRGLLVGAHLLLGCALLSFLVLSAVPLRAWFGIAYFGGCGLLMTLLPWLGGRLRALDPSSLQTRLALAVALATGLPLVGVVAVVSDRQERMVTAQTLDTQSRLAVMASRGVEAYLGTVWTSISQVAARPGVLEMPAEEQRAVLSSLTSTHPDVIVAELRDPTGRPMASIHGLAAAAPDSPIDEQSEPSAPSSVQAIQVIESLSQSVVVLSAPVIAPDGTVGGVVVATLVPGRLTSLLGLGREDEATVVKLLGSHGETVATSSGRPSDDRADALPAAPEQAARAARPGERGAVQYLGPSGPQLAGFARLTNPEWTVIVDTPSDSALAGVHAERRAAFLVLIACLGASILAGLIAASRLTQPLTSLADAMDDLSATNLSGPLPASDISQVRRLADAFGRMRDRIAAQSDERERLLSAEQSARAEAEASVRVRDEFIAVAAHELKTPVTSLWGFAQVVQRELDRNGQIEPDLLARAMARIDQQSKRLVTLTNQLLNLSRLQAGRIDLELEMTDLRTIVRDVIADERQSNPGREIRLADGDPASVRVDSQRIGQVLTSLIDNAIKFSPAEEPVEVSLDASDPEWVRLSVRDHGIGIPPEKLERVFERFYQAHPERHYGGMGVGLFLSRQIVEMHGGEIRPDQPEGRGIRFVVRLPRRNGPTVSTGAGDGGE